MIPERRGRLGDRHEGGKYAARRTGFSIGSPEPTDGYNGIPATLSVTPVTAGRRADGRRNRRVSLMDPGHALPLCRALIGRFDEHTARRMRASVGTGRGQMRGDTPGCGVPVRRASPAVTGVTDGVVVRCTRQ